MKQYRIRSYDPDKVIAVDRVPVALAEFYDRAKSYAVNAIELGVKWSDFREAIVLSVIDAAMEKAEGNKSRAARLLGMHRTHLCKYMANTRPAYKMRHTKSE